MRRAVLPLVILATVVVAALLAWATLRGSHYRGAGGAGGDDYVKESHTLAPFTAIDVTGLAEVVLVQGATDAVTIEVPRGQASRITATVRDRTLAINGSDVRDGPFGMFSRNLRPSRITVTFRSLEAIDASGAVKISASQLRTPMLKVNVSGTGLLRIDDLQTQLLKVAGSGAFKAELAGKATEQVVAISGAGNYQAAQLESNDARVAVSGAGKVVVNAKKTLKVGLSGAGIVEYLGDPELKQSVSGIGKVRRREASDGVANPAHFLVALPPSVAINAGSPRPQRESTPA